ncbi:CDP-abequose synthase [Candidatus Magnetaquicoccaceae bacterium FCR-1]|uniref:CDP-abequose synthase n=1 Tax=Candidatus Magnetaquiglobus chichijimensis TaxID=3141448 RepID=A0ABQ0CBU2_9PROT
MHVLLTGATGYLGSHLAHALVAGGVKVSILKRSTSCLTRLADIQHHLAMFDIDEKGIEAPFRSGGHIDAIIHAATSYGRNGENEFEVFKVNTQFPLDLLQTATCFNTETFFNTDTILHEYLNAYALSKQQFSQWGRIFAESTKIQFVNIRLEHIYGPGDDSSKFTTWMIRQCLNRASRIPLTKGEQMRDFIYIEDVVAAYMLMFKNLTGQKKVWQEVALGSGTPVKIRHFAETVKKLTNSDSELDFGAFPYRNNEIMSSSADISTLNAMGWASKWSLEAGLSKVIEMERIE